MAASYSNLEQLIASSIYKKLKAAIPSVPPFSFQIFEELNFNSQILFISQPSNLSDKYFNDDTFRLSFEIILLDDKLDHQAQLTRIGNIVDFISNLWEIDNYEILKKEINKVPVFRSLNNSRNWIQLEIVKIDTVAQRYDFTLDILIKEIKNV